MYVIYGTCSMQQEYLPLYVDMTNKREREHQDVKCVMN